MTADQSRDSVIAANEGAREPRFSETIATHAYRARHRMRIRLSILSVGLAVSGSLSAAEPLFDLKKVADGVYIALARRQPILNSNAAVIILDDGVLVVDTHSKPSAARALIEQIKTVTDKPVRYVVDTHFHYDHFQGNSAYLQAFPGRVEIISSAATHRGIVHRGVPRIKAEIANLPEQIDVLKHRLARTTNPTDQAELKREIAATQEYLQELKNIGDVIPTLTFEKSLVLHRKDRIVEILFLGRGHTDGDTVVFLPKEKILCTGDLVHAWVPYMPDSHPYDWIRTLEAVEKLDFDRIISGHGDVLTGKKQVTLWKDYLRDLMAQVENQYANGATLDEIKRNVDLSKYESLMGIRGVGSGLAGALNGHIEKAFREISWSP